jgi:hypothetical protein
MQMLRGNFSRNLEKGVVSEGKCAILMYGDYSTMSIGFSSDEEESWYGS